MDTRSPEQRRHIMQSVGTKNTKPEVAVRQLLHGLGYRYRLHRADLPGTPDIVFPRRRKVLLVHGCFWHGHGCRKGQLPKSRLEYWGAKIDRNKQRDEATIMALTQAGWSALVIWQCEIADLRSLTNRLVEFLGPPANSDRLVRAD